MRRVFEICFGLCYDEITIGQKFPNNGAAFIDQGGQTLPGNHLGNTLADDVPRTFTFRYYQTDQAGTTELGNDFFITYSYDPTLGVDNNIGKHRVLLMMGKTIKVQRMIICNFFINIC